MKQSEYPTTPADNKNSLDGLSEDPEYKPIPLPTILLFPNNDKCESVVERRPCPSVFVFNKPICPPLFLAYPFCSDNY